MKVLVIDTLVTVDSSLTIGTRDRIDSAKPTDFDFTDSLASLFLVKMRFLIRSSIVTNNTVNISSVPLAILLYSPDTELQLPLDDSGGLLLLKGAYLLKSDTIRISRYTVFHNCFSDTIKEGIGWYKKYNTDPPRDLKYLKSKRYPDKAVLKTCKTIYPATVSITVNQKSYFFMPEIRQRKREMTWYHGYKKINFLHLRSYEKAREKGKPVKYFAGYRDVYKSSLNAELVL